MELTRNIDPQPSHYHSHHNGELEQALSDTPVVESMAYQELQHIKGSESAKTLPEQKSLLEQVSDALRRGEIPCTKKAVSQRFKLSTEEVDKIFEELTELEQLGKKPNRHYHWIGEQEAA